MIDRVAKLSIADSERFIETVAFWSQRRAKNRDLLFEFGEGAPSAATKAELRIVALEADQNENACFASHNQG
jgi:hypothetical protein